MKPDFEMPAGRLRPTRPDDLEGALALLRQPEVRRYLCDDIMISRATVATMLAESAEMDARGLGLWIVEGCDGQLIGLAGLQPVSPEVAASPAMVGGVEPFIALETSHWGQGLAQAVVGVLVRHARDTLGLTRLVAAVDAPNLRSHRLLTRSHFTAIDRTLGPAHELVLYERILK